MMASRRMTASFLYYLKQGFLQHTRPSSLKSCPSVMDGLYDSNLDPFQVQLLSEQCIVVDKADKAIGMRSKRDCHLMTNINKGLLHRAFSVFLFNSRGELLVQRRSDMKITFPGLLTNTCCSHPLYNVKEMEENDFAGIKRAAQRRLHMELGINPEQISIKEFHFITRILYKAPSNGHWGEHEIDYVLFLQKDISVQPNPQEVKDCFYLSREKLKELLASGAKVTPWFRLIVSTFLYKWWDHLEDLGSIEDHTTIHHLE